MSRVPLGLLIALQTACAAAAPQPRPAVTGPTIPPSEHTVDSDVEDGLDGQAIYITNNSSVPIIVTSIHLSQCANIASPCTRIPLQVRIAAGTRGRIFTVRPVDWERSYSYRYAWTWTGAAANR